jgi:hypothetical protein
VKRSHRAWALAALAGLGLLAGCTSGGSTRTVPAGAPATGTSPAGTGPATQPAVNSPSTPPGKAPAATPVSPRESPASVLAAALAVLKAGSAVHIAISTTSSAGTITFSDDATAGGGRQLITTGYGGDVTILFIAGVGYVQANAAGLVGMMQVSQSQAQSEAGQWISIRPGQELGQDTYEDVVDGITLSSVAASELTIAGPLTLTGPTTVAGQAAIGVRGRAPASMQLPPAARVTLYVATSDARPLRYAVSGVSGYTDQITFSDWGESLRLAAPSAAVPASAGTPIVT